MKKSLIVMVSIAVLITTLAGCNGKNDVNEKAKETAKLETKVDGKKVDEDFDKVLESKDPLKVKEFIFKNINKENGDKMVTHYENLLIANFEELSNKCISGKYKTIIEEAKNKDGSLDFERVKDEGHRKEVKDMINSGYFFKMAEGDYYLYIDYAMINDKFSGYLSSKLKPYYDLRKREVTKPTFISECLNIDFKEVKDRAKTLENFIKNNKDFKNKEDLKLLMTRYILGLLSIDKVSKTLNSDTGKVEEIVKVSYGELRESDLLISKQAAIAMDSLLEKYNYVIKPNDKEGIKKINELKFKIGNKVAQKVGDELLK